MAAGGAAVLIWMEHIPGGLMSTDARSIRLLLVDGRDAVRGALACALGWRGHEVNSAVDLAAAQRICARRQVDVAVLQLADSEDDGVLGCRTLLSYQPGLPVIVCAEQGSAAQAQRRPM